MLIGSLMSKLGLDDSDYRTKLRAAPGHAAAAMAQTKLAIGSVAPAVGKMGSDFTSALARPLHDVERLAGSIFNLKNIIVGSIVGEGIKKMIEPAVEMAQSLSQLTATTGNSKLAKEFQELSEARARKGVFSAESYAGGIKAMYNMAGAAFVTVKNIKMIEDASARVGMGFDSVARMVARVMGNVDAGQRVGMRLMRLQMMQVVDAATAAKVKALEAAKAPAADIKRAIEEGMSRSWSSFDIMSTSPLAKLKAFKETVTQSFEAMGMQILNSLVSVLDALTGKLDRLRTSGQLELWGARIAYTLQQVGKAVMGVFRIIRDNWDTIMNVAKLALIAYGVKVVGDAFMGLAMNAAVLGTAIVTLKPFIASLMTVLGANTIGAVTGLAAAFMFCASAVYWAYTRIRDNWGEVSSIFHRTTSEAETSSGFWGEWAVNTLNGFQMVLVYCREFGQTFANIFVEIGTNVATIFKNLFVELKDRFMNFIKDPFGTYNDNQSVAESFGKRWFKGNFKERMLEGTIPLTDYQEDFQARMDKALAGPGWGDKLIGKNKGTAFGLNLPSFSVADMAKGFWDGWNKVKPQEWETPNIMDPWAFGPGNMRDRKAGPPENPNQFTAEERQYAPVATRGSVEAYNIQTTRFDRMLEVMGQQLNTLQDIETNTEDDGGGMLESFGPG